MFERRSALASAFDKAPSSEANRTARLKIGEVRGWSLIQIAAFASTLPQLQSAAEPLLGFDLPQRIGVAQEMEGRLVMKTGPEQFWILGPAHDDLSKRLLTAVAPAVGAVTPLSHSRTRIFIEGADAREVLARGIPIDFHPEVFATGHFALTSLHHTPVLVHRVAAARYEIYAMRTFAFSIWELVADAALSFGPEIQPPLA